MDIKTITNELSGIMAQMHAQANLAGVKFNDCYNVEHKPGASLFEPINGDPFVVVFEDKKATRHTFKPVNQSSGTDKLRARIIATRFYEEVAA